MANTNKILDKHRINLEDVKKSQKWYNEQITKLKKSGITATRMFANSTGLSTAIHPGSLYFFHYDPKLKDKLPYYDTFPMVFPYKAVPGGFLALNLHYLGYNERFAVFKKLLHINSGVIDEKTKIKYSWALISNIASIKSVRHCIKHYLNEHVASPFLMVQPQDWTTCMLLPVEKFVGASKEYVWSQSRK